MLACISGLRKSVYNTVYILSTKRMYVCTVRCSKRVHPVSTTDSGGRLCANVSLFEKTEISAARFDSWPNLQPLCKSRLRTTRRYPIWGAQCCTGTTCICKVLLQQHHHHFHHGIKWCYQQSLNKLYSNQISLRGG